MSMHLMTFKSPFGNNKAENQNLILTFSLTDRNIMIVVVKRVNMKSSNVFNVKLQGLK